jgi:energy-coupling factor transport system substrate-specific component
MLTSEAIPGRWRTVDIVLGAVLAVAFGAVFQAWNVLWASTGPAFVALPPLQGFMYGVWLLPAVLVPLVIRRPGAALLGEGAAALASVLFGAQWGLLTLVYGLVQGGAAELVFGAGLYRRWGLPSALLAGAAAGAAAALLDLALYYPDWAADFQALYAGPGDPQRGRHRRSRRLAAGARPGPHRRAERLPRRPRAAGGLSR